MDRDVVTSRRGSGRRPPRRAATATAVLLAAAGLAVTGAASAPALAAPRAAQPMTPAWRIVKQVHSGIFGPVVAVGKNGGWAFDSNFDANNAVSTAWRRSGSTWTKVPFPDKANETVVAAGATSPTNVWAFTAGPLGSGFQSQALRWDGRSWTVQRTFSGQIGGDVVISPSDVWVFGQPFFPSAGFGAWHYNGHTWTHVASGHGLQGGSGLWLPMPGVDGQKSYLLHYSAGHLTPVAFPGGPSRTDIESVALIPGTPDALAGGDMHTANQPGVNTTAILLQYGL